MTTYTLDGGRIYECDICHEPIGYCGPNDDEQFLDDLLIIKGNMEVRDEHIHRSCMNRVVEEIKKIAERRKQHGTET